MGKTTQAALLSSRLRAGGYDAASVQPLLVLFDPWGGAPDSRMGKSLSPRLQRARTNETGKRGVSLARTSRALLGAAYAAVSYAFLRLRFRRHQVVVCDRYFYQYFYDLFGDSAEGFALMFPRPDLAYWLDGSPDLVRARTADENLQGDWGPYYQALMQYFRRIAGPLRFVRIDASATPEAISESIWSDLVAAIGGGTP